MSFSIGIIGLPNTGKSTLFKALTKNPVLIAPYAFSTKDPNIGLAPVPDQRLEAISKIINPPKVTPAFIEFVDIAGLIRGAHKGEGLGNQFLGHIRNCKMLVEVVRAFKRDDVEHTEGTVNPQRDIEIIKTELLMKDLETAEALLEKLEKEAKQDKVSARKYGLFKRIRTAIGEGRTLSQIGLNEEEKAEIDEFQFLTAKPIIYLFNVDETTASNPPEIAKPDRTLYLNLKLEEEISELNEGELRELGITSGIAQLIAECYELLDLVTFYTIAGHKETRAWALKKGETAMRAGGIVHSDFEEKFIKAEVISCQKLIEAGSWTKARELGLIKTEGKEYIVQDGDVIEFKI